MSDLEHVWKTYEGSLLNFVHDIWMPRMEKVIEQRNRALDEGELKRIRDIGVVIRPEIEVHESQMPTWGTYEWFEWEVRQIMGQG